MPHSLMLYCITLNSVLNPYSPSAKIAQRTSPESSTPYPDNIKTALEDDTRLSEAVLNMPATISELRMLFRCS